MIDWIKSFFGKGKLRYRVYVANSNRYYNVKVPYVGVLTDRDIEKTREFVRRETAKKYRERVSRVEFMGEE